MDKEHIQKFAKRILFAFLFIMIGSIVLLLIALLLLLLVDPYFFYIDACLDGGGQWNEEVNDCEGSKSYTEWKERTWY